MYTGEVRYYQKSRWEELKRVKKTDRICWALAMESGCGRTDPRPPGNRRTDGAFIYQVQGPGEEHKVSP